MAAFSESSLERIPSPELWRVNPIVEYDPNDGRVIEWAETNDPMNSSDDSKTYATSSYVKEARMARWKRRNGKVSFASPVESGDALTLCYQTDPDRRSASETKSDKKSSYFIVGFDEGHNGGWLASFGFDALLATTDEYVDVLRSNVRYRLMAGQHSYSQSGRKPLESAPDFFGANRSIRVYELTPTDEALENPSLFTAESASAVANKVANHWKVLESPIPETADLLQKERIAASYFEASVEAVFSHVSRNVQNYPAITEVRENGDPAALHLPAVSMNGRYYQVSTSSSQQGTHIRVQRVQPGTNQDTVGDVIKKLSLQEFSSLLNEPEKLESLFDDALSEGQLMLLQVPAGEVIVIGGDSFEKRLEAKDEPYLSVVRKATELVKTYLEEVERLPANSETLLDKRRALAKEVLKRIESEKEPENKQSSFRWSLDFLWRAITLKP